MNCDQQLGGYTRIKQKYSPLDVFKLWHSLILINQWQKKARRASLQPHLQIKNEWQIAEIDVNRRHVNSASDSSFDSLIFYWEYSEVDSLLNIEVSVVDGNPQLSLDQLSYGLDLLLSFHQNWKYINISLVDNTSLSKVMFSKSELSERDNNIKEITLINKVKNSSSQDVNEFVAQVLWYIGKLQITEVIFNGFSYQDLEIILDFRIDGLFETVSFIRFEGSNDDTISNEIICIFKNKKVVNLCVII